jgi:pyocin large subunit-like protein
MRAMTFAAVAAMVLAGGCGNGGSAVETRDREAEVQAAAASGAAPSAADAGSDASAAPSEAERGRPVWSEARNRTPEEGAQRSFERNGEDFGAASVDAYIRQAHAFIADPPPGTERVQRRNGDTLYFHAPSNTFAVATRDGAPRTLFRPDEGAAYWAEQRASAERQGGGEG